MSSYDTKLKRLFGVLALAVALQLANPIYAADPTSGGKTIVFVCLHGAVNSQVAAAHFNRIASERGLPYTAIAHDGQVCGRQRLSVLAYQGRPPGSAGVAAEV